MKKLLPLVTLSLIAAFVLSGCGVLELFVETVEGSGEVTVEKRELGSFNAIEAHGDIELYVTQQNTGIEVHAETNLMKYIQTYVEDQKLIIEIVDTDGSSINLKPLKPIQVYVKLVRIISVSLSGGVDFTSGQLLAENAEMNLSLIEGSTGKINAVRTGVVNIHLSGNSELEIVDGQVTEQHINASNGSQYIAEWLKSEVTEIELSEGSEATIWAEETFNVDLSGGSMAYYYGSPVNLNEIRSKGGSDYISRGER